MLKGISGYIYGLYLKKTFGVNEYRHWIKEVKVFVSTVTTLAEVVITAQKLATMLIIVYLFQSVKN